MASIQLTSRKRHLVSLGLLMIVLMIAVPAIITYRAENELRDSMQWVTHTQAVEQAIDRLLVCLTDAESGQRGFVLTKQENFLDSYHEGVPAIGPGLVALRTLTVDNPVQVENIRQLQPLLDQKLEFMEKTIALEKAGQPDQAMAMIVTGTGKKLMDGIRAVLTKMAREEKGLLGERQKQLNNRVQLARTILWGLVLVAGLCAATVIVLLQRLARAQTLVNVCAWSRTIEFNGEWISFEEYLKRRFDIDTSHGISPLEAEKLIAEYGAGKKAA